jgi:hypothetical protein
MSCTVFFGDNPAQGKTEAFLNILKMVICPEFKKGGVLRARIYFFLSMA